MNDVEFVLLVSSTLIALKVLLIPAYSSTDLEVHRNWLAVTWNKNTTEWYTEATSEWTLDYPPFFAFFQCALAWIAYFTGYESILKISKEPIFDQDVLHFQRTTVICTDVGYLLVCAFFAFNNKQVDALPKKMAGRARRALFAVLATCPCLLIVDSIHFQYNSMLTAILLLSIHFMDNGRFHLGALFFSILISFKHIYVYYALGYAAAYIHNYFELRYLLRNWDNSRHAKYGEEKNKILRVAYTFLIPFFFSFGTIMWQGGLLSLVGILKRMFPVSRGLTHAFWAPNMWAIYNTVDLILYRIGSVLGISLPNPPTYTSGLVHEYRHCVLRSVWPSATMILVVAASKVAFYMGQMNNKNSFCLVISSSVFFFFGYHVHEKAILLPLIPMIVLAFQDLRFGPKLIELNVISTLTVLPLIYTDDEFFIKYTISISCFLVVLLAVKYVTGSSFDVLIPPGKWINFGLLTIVEIYHSYLHKALFASRFPFLPKMIMSVVLAFYFARFILQLIAVIPFSRKLWPLYEEEKKIKSGFYPITELAKESNIRKIGGVDISASKSNSMYGVVTFSVFSYPDLVHLASFSDAVILHPYQTSFLAMREAETIVGHVKRVLQKNPDLRPDVLLYDGNGQYHDRKCGAACHVGARTGIPTIGVAKKLMWANYKERDFYDDQMSYKFALETIKMMKTDETAIWDSIMSLIRKEFKTVLFVSVGYGLDLDLATKVALNSWISSTTCEPIRMADLVSRKHVRDWID